MNDVITVACLAAFFAGLALIRWALRPTSSAEGEA